MGQGQSTPEPPKENVSSLLTAAYIDAVEVAFQILLLLRH